MARKAVLSSFCALEFSKTGWSEVTRVKIVFLTLKVILVCHFIRIADVIGLREARRVSKGIVILKPRKTELLKVKDVSAVDVVLGIKARLIKR